MGCSDEKIALSLSLLLALSALHLSHTHWLSFLSFHGEIVRGLQRGQVMLLVVEHGSFTLLWCHFIIVLLLNTKIDLILSLSFKSFRRGLHLMLNVTALERSWRENLRLVGIECNLTILTLRVINLLVLAYMCKGIVYF